MFTKLFSSITTSSIWNEDNNTRIVWVTMLAMSNKNGYVSASVGGLAHEARVSREDCERALKVLCSPDEDSRSKEHEGRRVSIIDGGFQLLNHQKYRAMRSEEERKDYMKTYMAEYRRTKNVNKSVNNVSECKPPLAQADTEADAEADKEEETLPSVGLHNSSDSEGSDDYEKGMKVVSALKNGRSKKAAVEDFKHLWAKAYMAAHGLKYLDQGKKDDYAAQKLTNMGIDPRELIKTAVKAWARNDDFHCKETVTIAGFASRYNNIMSIVGSKKSRGPNI